MPPKPSPSDIRDRRFERDVERLCDMGPRAVAELLREIGATTLLMTAIEQTVERYSRLDPNAVRLAGGDQFPARPTLRVVGGRRNG